LYPAGPDHFTDNPGNICKVTTTAFQSFHKVLMLLMAAGDSLAEVDLVATMCRIMVKIICTYFLSSYLMQLVSNTKVNL